MTKSPNLSRRDFVTGTIGLLGTIMGTVIGLPAIGYLLSPAFQSHQAEAWIPLGKMESFPEGTPTLVSFTRTKQNGWERTVNSFGVYVLRKGSQALVLSNLCTHLSCRVTWQTDANQYHCPCHDGGFDIQGQVTGGPPPRPLEQYETKVEDGTLSILLKEA
jgi:Rieske Fe-S protein